HYSEGEPHFPVRRSFIHHPSAGDGEGEKGANAFFAVVPSSEGSRLTSTLVLGPASVCVFLLATSARRPPRRVFFALLLVPIGLLRLVGDPSPSAPAGHNYL